MARMKSSDAAVENPVEMETEPVAEAAEPETKRKAGPSPYLRCLVTKDAGVGGILLRKGTTVVLRRSVAERAHVLNAVKILGDEWK